MIAKRRGLGVIVWLECQLLYIKCKRKLFAGRAWVEHAGINRVNARHEDVLYNTIS